MEENNSEIITIRFNEIKEIRLKIKNKIKKIEEIKGVIKTNYINYIKGENKEYFGLDSFHFQNKVMELEHENMLKLYHFIDNRIYGDYYKLFILMTEFFNHHLNEKQMDRIKELKNIKSYPIYKDLEPFRLYEFDLIDNIHQDIILIINAIKDIYQENIMIIKEYKKQLRLGMNIDNYIINQQFINNNLMMRNNLYENYLNVYHGYHNDLLCKYYEKLQLFFNQINHHIISDQNSSIDSDDTSKDSSTDSPKNDIITNKDIFFSQQDMSEDSISLEEDICKNKILDLRSVVEEVVNKEDISNNELHGFQMVQKKKKRKKKKKKKH